MFWILQLYYPNDQRFTPQNFGRCPVSIVLQAVSTYEAERLKTLEYQARPIGKLGSLVCRLAGNKDPKDEWVNSYALIQQAKEVRSEIPQTAAQTFLTLHKQGKVPSWVMAMVDLDRMKLAA